MPRRPHSPCRGPACSTLLPGYGYCPDCTATMVRTTQITLVTGPPCAGKNTYVRHRAKPGDLIVDFDAIISAIGGAGDHDQPEHLKPFALDARDAVVERLFTARHDVQTAWIILSAPQAKDRETYRRRGAHVVLLLPDQATCHARARAERPPAWLDYIDGWYSAYTPAAEDEVIGGDGG